VTEVFPQIVAGLLTLAVGGLGSWVWSISSKVTVLETKETTAQILASSQDNSLRELLKEKFDNIERRLNRIETAINGRHGE
jgi:hypothetical protein